MKRILFGAVLAAAMITQAGAATHITAIKFASGNDREIVAIGSGPTTVYLCNETASDAQFAYWNAKGQRQPSHLVGAICQMLQGITGLQVFAGTSHWSGTADIWVP